MVCMTICCAAAVVGVVIIALTAVADIATKRKIDQIINDIYAELNIGEGKENNNEEILQKSNESE